MIRLLKRLLDRAFPRAFDLPAPRTEPGFRPPPAPAEPARCLGCGAPFEAKNAWMLDGCPCNSPAGVNDTVLGRLRGLPMGGGFPKCVVCRSPVRRDDDVCSDACARKFLEAG